MLQGGQTLAARYVLLRRLGAGRVTQVWQARDRDTGADRVLKILSSDLPGERERFLAAVRLQQQVAHPNLQACAAVHDDSEPPFAVFAGVATGDLANLRGRPWRQLLPVLAGVADGLTALHEHGLVHRDLKAANVLIGADGEPLLADFGLASRIGDAQAPRGGSPFTMSPQQLTGLPPAPADDIYAFGALAYELLGGYPPFYPDAAAERVRSETPAALPERAAVPTALAQLVERCLAKEPAARPSTARELAATLRDIARDQPSSPSATTPVELRPPPHASEAVVDARWPQATEQAPSPAQLRSQGFRRGLVAASLAFLLLVAAFVFFVLPERVQRAATPVPAPAAEQVEVAVPATEDPDLQRLAESRREFEELRPRVVTRLEGLEQRAAGTWGGEEFARGKRLLGDADGDFGRREYVTALEDLRRADADLAATEQRVAARLDEALAAGATALEKGDAALATREFELALSIAPENGKARRGLERAGTLVRVRALLAEATALEERGDDAAAAAAYRKALALDRDTETARQALVRLEAQASSTAFAAAMADGLESLARGDHVAARSAFERAGKLRPGAPEVAEGLAQAERGLAASSIGGHLEAARQAERDERWSVALAEYRKALAIDANLLPARQGLERAEPRAMLDAELTALLDRPERMFSAEIRGAARATVQRARAVPTPGPVLTRQVQSLERLLREAETPLRVVLASDNATDVTINRVGRLGSFERMDVELLPGRYTVVGVRAGFRDVRREFTLVPGRDAPTVTIRCEEPI